MDLVLIDGRVDLGVEEHGRLAGRNWRGRVLALCRRRLTGILIIVVAIRVVLIYVIRPWRERRELASAIARRILCH